MHKSLKFAYHFAILVCGVSALLSGTRTFYYFFIVLLVLRLVSWRVAVHYKDNLFLRSASSTETITSGEKIQITYRLTNASMLPLWHGRIYFQLPREMQSNGMREHALFLGPQETLPFEEEIQCPLRGYYAVGDAALYVSDPMGFHKDKIVFSKTVPITVYPRIVALSTLLFKPRAEGGNLKVQDRSRDDRTHLLNLREYVKGDDLKNIHWKLSAKKDQLVVREFHKSVSERLTVFMDGFYGNWGGAFDALAEERMVSFCASFLKGTLDLGMDFTLYLNNQKGDHFRGDRAEAMSEIMAMLTAFRSDGSKQFEIYLAQQLEKAVVYEHVVFIVPHVSLALVEYLTSLGMSYDLYTLRADGQVLDYPHIKFIDKYMGGTSNENT